MRRTIINKRWTGAGQHDNGSIITYRDRTIHHLVSIGAINLLKPLFRIVHCMSDGGDRDTVSENGNNDTAISRRKFLKLAGIGSLGLGASYTGLQYFRNTPTGMQSSINPCVDGSTSDAGQVGGDIAPGQGSTFRPGDGFADTSWFPSPDLEVVKVTSLDRSALESAVGRSNPTLVVFEVGGVIDLQQQVVNIGPNTYVAGQTAPSPGITLIKGELQVNGDNVIVQHMRSRPGSESGSSQHHAFEVSGGTSNPSDNVVIDHCSATWGIDETLSIAGIPNFQGHEADQNNVDITNCIIAEGLKESGLHPKGGHSKGLLIRRDIKGSAVLGNLIAHHDDRLPRIAGGSQCAVANNMMYNRGTGYFTKYGRGGDSPTNASFVSNVYWSGPSSQGTQAMISPAREYGGQPMPDPLGHIYMEDNASKPSDRPRIDTGRSSHTLEVVNTKPVWPEGLEVMSSDQVPTYIQNNAGARPADRTPHDNRIINSVNEGSGQIIDREDEVGGYPDLEETQRTLTVPDSGLGDWLNQHTAAVEQQDATPP